MTPLEPRKHQLLAVVLAGDIVSGRREEGGDFPSSDELTEQYSVSRTVAREVLQALAAAGLVRVQHGKRSVVTGVSDWRFLDPFVQDAMESERLPVDLVGEIYGARRVVEVETARLCAGEASHGTDADLEEIVERTAAVVAAIEDDSSLVSEIARLDRAFHGVIADGSGNLVLARIARDLHRGVLPSWQLVRRRNPSFLRVVQAQHCEIAEAIQARDTDVAAESMRNHLDWSLTDTIAPDGSSAEIGAQAV